MWKNKVHEYDVMSGTINGRFELLTPKKIKTVETSCGCTVSKFDENGVDYSIVVTEPAFNIPKPLYNAGKKDYNKVVNINVLFEGEEDYDELYVKLHVYEHKFDELSY